MLVCSGVECWFVVELNAGCETSTKFETDDKRMGNNFEWWIKWYYRRQFDHLVYFMGQWILLGEYIAWTFPDIVYTLKLLSPLILTHKHPSTAWALHDAYEILNTGVIFKTSIRNVHNLESLFFTRNSFVSDNSY